MLERARSWGWGSKATSILARFAVGALLAIAGVTASLGADAAPTTKAPPKTGKPVMAKLAPDVVKRLSSSNEDDVKSALDDIRLIGTGAAAAAPQVAAILDRGAHRELTVSALETLGDLHVASTGPSIVPYTGHREISIRKAAVTALGETHGDGSIPALRRALGDPSEDVRTAAAHGLATKEAAPVAMDLAAAIDHKISGAGLALGAACTEANCNELAGRLGKADNADVSAGLDRLFERTDLPESVKLDVLTKLASSSDPAVHSYLVALRAKQPKNAKGKPTPFAKALDTAVSGVSR